MAPRGAGHNSLGGADMKSIKNIWRKLAGKGYYIALVLCAVAIGITGYLYYRSSKTPEPVLQNNPTDSTDVPVLSPDSPVDAPVTQTLQTARPLTGETITDHSVDRLCYNPTTRDWRTHAGIDIAAQEGTPVCAAADGVVYTTYRDDLLGTTVVIRHDGGYLTTYANLSAETAVTPGQTVTLGQTIGYVGSSAIVETALGDHLHFSVTCNDQWLDPTAFFQLG